MVVDVKNKSLTVCDHCRLLLWDWCILVGIAFLLEWNWHDYSADSVGFFYCVKVDSLHQVLITVWLNCGGHFSVGRVVVTFLLIGFLHVLFFLGCCCCIYCRCFDYWWWSLASFSQLGTPAHPLPLCNFRSGNDRLG